MTRNSEIDCRDLFECKHELEIPLSQDGEIVQWRCRCGARVETVPLNDYDDVSEAMKIYVASSWRNGVQPTVVTALRKAGYDVYDFRNPAPGDHGFSWSQCAEPEQLSDPRRFRDEVLTHPVARAAFAKDMDALRDADVVVLVLPCGRSAHLELGWAAGAGKRTVVLLDDPMGEPELMYLMNTAICASMDEVLRFLCR